MDRIQDMSYTSLPDQQLSADVISHSTVASRAAKRKITRRMLIGRVLCWGYVLMTVLICVLLRTAGEHWWPITLMLYGPRWIGLLPIPFLAFFGLVERRLFIVIAGTTALYSFLIMGFNVPIGRLIGSSAHAPTFRLLTLNAHRASTDPAALADLIDREHPDVVLIQDYTSRLEPALRSPALWTLHREGELFIASRFPLERSENLELSTMVATGEVDDGRDGMAVRYTLEAPFARVQLIGLHLASPHTALGSFIDKEAEATAEMMANSTRRFDESSIIRASTRGEPTIVAGDFNTVPDSPVFSTWSSFSDAFSQTGFGLGYTHFNRWTQIRIDHILFSQGWHAQRCWVGTPVGSPHRPLLADLKWTGQ
jgi:vancomycin resistance protein VanJ